jgi:hypothetical protein
MTRNDLRIIWQDVEAIYNYERINSERALQAVLYHALTNRLPDDYLILVEPSLAGYCPDLVIANRVMKVVACILELKCAPHWWHSESDVAYDLNKLNTYIQLRRSTVEFDVFGPQRVFDSKHGVWIGGRPQYTVPQDALFGFVDIARKESVVVSRNRMSHPVAKLSNFVLLSGAIDPNAKTAIFSLQ